MTTGLQNKLAAATDPAQRAKIERRLQFLKSQPKQTEAAATSGGGARQVATGQRLPNRPARFWDKRLNQAEKLGQKIAPEYYDGSLPTVQDEYRPKADAYLDLLNERARTGMSQEELNQIEGRGMAEISRAIGGANRAGAQSLARGGALGAGGAGNALRMDIARGVGDNVRGLQSDMAGQNLAFKQANTQQYGGALDTAANRGILTSQTNADLARADLASRVAATGTGLGLLEQTRAEGMAEKARGEDMDLAREIERLRLEYAKQLGAF